jgi:hypothetical protein
MPDCDSGKSGVRRRKPCNSLIADALVARGIAVQHILAVSRAQPHVLRPWSSGKWSCGLAATGQFVRAGFVFTDVRSLAFSDV